MINFNSKDNICVDDIPKLEDNVKSIIDVIPCNSNIMTPSDYNPSRADLIQKVEWNCNDRGSCNMGGANKRRD